MPLDSLINLLGGLAGMTGCSGIVDLKQVQASPDIQRLAEFAGGAQPQNATAPGPIPIENANTAANSNYTDGNMSNVSPSNKPPVANAGTDQVTNPGDGVVLDGTYSKDPDNDLMEYQWIQIAGPYVKLVGANTVTPFFTAPSNVSSNMHLMFRLTVTDSKNATGIDYVKVTID